ncbi:SRPBCC domain-containing protein [Bacteriovorax sp. Seq25_V]|uniref:SRPBCC family protein n=1 Tax=Bacteriovorax sp. Seq25_V TaxID=1201288 RepID=UPI00038A16C7|nr:SRPBCC domain-containing protein [Bacteriovorax sp. Seq25_V]EQC45259.1 hypothetical protein M900_2284 [Bacteriovorax sp. Seq25_V]
MEYHTKKRFNVRPNELFEDFSNFAKMQSWMIKDDSMRTNINADFSPGGKYHFEMVSDIGDISHYYGEYTSIYPNRHIDMVWNDGEVKDTLVTLDFVENERHGTTLLLTHANLPTAISVKHHKEFWRNCLEHLDAYVKKVNAA